MRGLISRAVTVAVWILAVIGVATMVIFGLVRAQVITTLNVTSGSMEPTFSAGDALISTRVDAADIVIGDVITAPDGAGRLVTHRVVDIADGMDSGSRLITMRGDANSSEDIAPYAIEEALRMRAVIPHGADVSAFLTTPPTPYLGLLVIACFIAYTFVTPSRPAAGGNDDEEQREKEPATA